MDLAHIEDGRYEAKLARGRRFSNANAAEALTLTLAADLAVDAARNVRFGRLHAIARRLGFVRV